ncbi:hypothetical protein PCE1_004641 [Barthelona sp. PCE]
MPSIVAETENSGGVSFNFTKVKSVEISENGSLDDDIARMGIGHGFVAVHCVDEGVESSVKLYNYDLEFSSSFDLPEKVTCPLCLTEDSVVAGISTGNLRRKEISSNILQRPSTIRVSPNGRHLRSVDAHPSGDAYILSTFNDAGTLIFQPKVGSGIHLVDDDSYCTGAMFLPDGRFISTWWDGTVRIYEHIDNDIVLQSVSTEKHKFWIHTMDLTHNGKTLVTGGEDSSIYVWNTDTLELIHRIESDINIQGISVDHTGNIIAGISRKNFKAMLYSVSTAELLTTIHLDEKVHGISFLPNEHKLIIVTEKTLSLWED